MISTPSSVQGPNLPRAARAALKISPATKGLFPRCFHQRSRDTTVAARIIIPSQLFSTGNPCKHTTLAYTSSYSHWQSKRPALAAPSQSFSTSTHNLNMASFYELKADQPNGEVFDFSQLKGKVVLIVNTASECGYTPQYQGLQILYEKYKDQGFVVLGFPSNQFNNQEPLDDSGIAQFCTRNFGVTFPLMKKSDVNGDNANEVYKWLKKEKSGLLGLTRIKWNFEKFLVDRDGRVIKRWITTTAPEAIDTDIAKAL